MYPHDHYDIHGEPRLHNHGEGRHYLENDYHAHDHDAQLPALSAIGRGPRGRGLTVGNIVSTETETSFALYDDLTGELVWQSPNLNPGTLDFYPTDFRDLSAGQPAPMDIVHTKGGVTKTTTAYLPAGEPGSLIYLYPNAIDRKPDDTYAIPSESLQIYGHYDYPHKPVPRPNDVIFFEFRDSKGHGFAFGTIEDTGTVDTNTMPHSVEDDVVFTARTFVYIPESGWDRVTAEYGDLDELSVEVTQGFDGYEDNWLHFEFNGIKNYDNLDNKPLVKDVYVETECYGGMTFDMTDAEFIDDDDYDYYRKYYDVYDGSSDVDPGGK